MNTEILDKALTHRNFLAEKKRNDTISFLELGFSNDGRLPTFTIPKVKKTAGFKNFIKSLRP